MKLIWVKFQRAGIHYFARAINDEDLKDVSYLGDAHRHLFKMKVSIEVFHDDREIEFHQFLNYLEGSIDNGTMELNNKSCEMICDDIAELVRVKYGTKRRLCIVEVSEDGECGATCTYYTREIEHDPEDYNID